MATQQRPKIDSWDAAEEHLRARVQEYGREVQASLWAHGGAYTFAVADGSVLRLLTVGPRGGIYYGLSLNDDQRDALRAVL